MKNLLYKEFRLVIHPLFYLVLLLGALLLIPEWVYFLAMMYFFFIVVPNVFSVAKSQNDIGFSAMLPVRRQDIVKARVYAIVIFEVVHILTAAIFAFINLAIYPKGNSLLDTNLTYIGCVFIMYGIYNIIFFPVFYKTAYKIGLPAIAATAATILFATGVELLILFVPALRILDGQEHIMAQLPVLAAGIALFIVMNIAALRISTKRFMRVNL